MANPSDVERLVSNTHLSYGVAQALLHTRTLTGNPEDHDHPAIIITEDEVVVETSSAFSGGRAPSPIEIALSSGATVEQLRKDAIAVSDLAGLEDSEDE